MKSCIVGTFISGGQRKGECWLSAQIRNPARPMKCGMPCVSFTVQATAPVPTTVVARRTQHNRRGVCKYGEYYVPDGWEGKGLQGNCHTCKCVWTDLQCERRPHCQEVIAQKHDERQCSHMSCMISFGTVQVSHHNKEKHGTAHRCAYSSESKECQCLCWNTEAPKRATATMEVVRASTVVPVTAASFCTNVAFEEVFRSSSAVVFSMLQPKSFLKDLDIQHQWIEKSGDRSFTVCAESPKPTTLLTEGHALSLSYVSWLKGQASPWPDTVTGIAKMNAAWGNGASHCKQVSFERKFKARPLVFGSIDRRQLIPDGDESIGHWIDNVTPESFTICMRGGYTSKESYDFPVFFNWVAAEGTTTRQHHPNNLIKLSGTSTLTNSKERKCVQIKFGNKLTKNLGVLVSSNAPGVTYDQLDASGVRACSSQGRPSGSIMFDWAVMQLQYPAEYIAPPLLNVV